MGISKTGRGLEVSKWNWFWICMCGILLIALFYTFAEVMVYMFDQLKAR